MDEYASIDYGKDYLAHHGVKGMKWGVRNTIERMGISRKLKKNEKQYVKQQQQMLNAIKTRNDFERAGGSKTPMAKRLNDNIKTIDKSIKANRNVANRLIKEAKSKGYSVSTKNSRTGVKEQAIRGVKVGAAVRGTKYGLLGAGTAAAYLGAAATVPITAPAAAIIIGSYAVGTGAAGAIKGGLLGGAMGAGVGTALVSNQRRNGYRYADEIFNKNNDVPASILYKKYSVSDMKHFDELYSDYLAHYGVKGMKWGVRKSVERTGRVVRKIGGAVKNSASRIAGGLVRTGSAVRRFKNKRAIKSGNSVRIASRIDKMTNQELADAVARSHLVSQLNINNGHNGGQGNGIIAANARNVANNFVRNSMESALSSVIGGEKFTDSMIKRYGGKTASEKANDAAQKYADYLKRQSANSTNILRTLENNKKINDFRNANTSNIINKQPKVQNIKIKTAKVSTIKEQPSTSKGYNFVRKSLYSNNTNTYSWQDSKYTRMGNDYLDYVNRLNHSDMFVSDFLAHYSILGMKWRIEDTHIKD